MDGTNWIRITTLALLALMSRGTFADMEWQSLPALVRGADTIARGTVTIEGDEVLLRVERILKGQQRRQIKVRYIHWFEVPDPQFKSGEQVLLFLHIPDVNGLKSSWPDIAGLKEGEMFLFGLSDQAKWPKPYVDPSKKWTAYTGPENGASLSAVENVVQKLLVIENTADLDEKAQMCAMYIRSSDPLLQYATMQYAQHGLLQPSQLDNLSPEESYEVSRKHFRILGKLAGEALPLIDSNEPAIRAHAILLLRYRQPTEVLPYVIEGITDRVASVCEAARRVLGTFAASLKLEEPFVNFSSRQKPEELASIQRQWSTWWENNKARLRAEEEEARNKAKARAERKR